MSVGAFLRWWRNDIAGLSQEQAASKASVGLATWQRCENDWATARPSTLTKIAQAHGIPSSVLLRVTSDPGWDYRQDEDLVRSAFAQMAAQLSNTTPATQERAQTIGFIFPDLQSPFFGYALEGLEEVASAAGYGVTVYNTREDPDLEAVCLAKAAERDAGVIVNAADMYRPDGYKPLLDAGVPIVFLDRYVDELRNRIGLVQTDNIEGGRLATKYLIERGHRRIYLFSERPTISAAHERKEGYLRALREAGFFTTTGEAAWCEEYVLESTAYDVEAGRKLGEQVLCGAKEAPIAIFAINDNIARGVYEVAAAHDLRIGRDVSIVGMDYLRDSLTVIPRLTTVRQSPGDMARAAAHLVLDQIRSGLSTAQESRFGVSLVEGDSVADLTAQPSTEEDDRALVAQLGYRYPEVYGQAGR